MGPPDTRRTVAFLSMGQAAVWATIFLSVFLGPFAVREMTGSFALGGLPFAMYFLSNLLVILPAGQLMDRIGRAPVLAIGHTVGAGGAATVAAGLFLQTSGLPWAVVVFLAGLFVLSAGSAIALMTRVAAADLYPPEGRDRGLGQFLLLSFVGSAAGAMVFVTLSSTGSPPVASGYLAMVPLFGLGSGAMLAVRRDLPMPALVVHRRQHLPGLLRRPAVGWTIASNAGANGGMVGVMSLASPALAGLGGLATGAIMLSHFGGMFLPSPLAGRVAGRRGRALAIALGGAVLFIGCLLFTRTESLPLAGAGLFLIGAGWCFTFIPGTALLADASGFAHRGSVFGANDTIVAIAGGISVIVAGFAFATWNVAGLAVLGAAYALLSISAGVRLQRRRMPTPVPA